jgi:hypothetical protein
VEFHSADAMALPYFLRNAHMKIKRRNSLKNGEEKDKRKFGVERLHVRGEQKFSGFEYSQAVPIRLSVIGTFEGR